MNLSLVIYQMGAWSNAHLESLIVSCIKQVLRAWQTVDPQGMAGIRYKPVSCPPQARSNLKPFLPTESTGQMTLLSVPIKARVGVDSGPDPCSRLWPAVPSFLER